SAGGGQRQAGIGGERCDGSDRAEDSRSHRRGGDGGGAAGGLSRGQSAPGARAFGASAAGERAGTPSTAAATRVGAMEVSEPAVGGAGCRHPGRTGPFREGGGGQ